MTALAVLHFFFISLLQLSICLISASTVQFMTSIVNDGSNHWLSFKSSQKSLQFQVRACENARILLSDQPYGTVVYQIIVGSEGNTKSTITRYNSGNAAYDVVAEESTPGVLNCMETKYFWLSWRNGVLELALGSSSGRRLIDWSDSNPRSVNALGVLSGTSLGSSWTYSYESG